jgi:multidrug efflux pump subunit AcrA (membrane-fusion protein)
MKRSSEASRWVLAAAVWCGAAGWAGAGWCADGPAAAAGGIAAPAKAGPTTRAVELPATVEAFAQVELYSMVSGYVSEVRADMGDAVRGGDVLASIAQPEREKDLLEARAVREAKAAAAQAAEAAVAQAGAALDTARRQLERYDAEVALREATLRRKQELSEGKAITDQELDDARTAAAVARADVGVARSKIAAAEADLRSAEAARAVAAAQVKVAEAGVGKIETWLAYGKVAAPFDGVVTRRMIDPGALVQASATSKATAMFTVQRIDQVRVFVEVPESDAADVRVGDAARVRPYGTSKEVFEGKVTRIASALDPGTRTMRVEVDLPNPTGRLMHGMYANVTLVLSARAR